MKKKILVHMCCGPCSIMPVKTMLEGEFEVSGFFYNPNIQPRAEYEKRLEGTKEMARNMEIGLVVDEYYNHDDYRAKDFFDAIPKNDKNKSNYADHGERCEICYDIRLEACVKSAKKHGFDAFTSSLLYSKYQNHEQIVELSKKLSKKYEIDFYYDDFRVGWGRGIKRSKKMGLYRQQYCGCVFSKAERGL